ncbi:plasmid maintenance system antidote protein [Serpentinimonas raichei]|uniref:Plasmid maintenance system antidote protein n=1 Tax=Serpentinimonas raichei TaxID=1458425 RepID=A0A060NGV7_9BURK|nr:HigA family addiction module antitoxin [Serpentinimonas raichei]BAO80237.1 plasmid maintenance system antidote protein [Serpentinimonas raichei]
MTREVPLIHPGEILLKDWLEPLGISQYALAKAIDVPRRRINEIVQGHRAISADTAARLGAFFGVDAEGWLALQAHYDAQVVRERLADVLPHIPRYDRPAHKPMTARVASL